MSGTRRRGRDAMAKAMQKPEYRRRKLFGTYTNPESVKKQKERRLEMRVRRGGDRSKQHNKTPVKFLWKERKASK